MRRHLLLLACTALSQLTLAQYADTLFPCPLHPLHSIPNVDFQLVDLNFDGRVDLLSLGMYPHGIDTALGLAQAGFEPTLHRPVSGKPRGMALADFDGDGNLDAVIAQCEDNATSGSYCVFLGDGTGSFLQPSTHLVAIKPNSVAAGDINGDIYPDLLIGDDRAGTTRVLWLQGANNGTFSAPKLLDMGPQPREVRLADVDGDGWLDAVAVTRWFGTRITVRRGTGSPASPFAALQHNAAPSLSQSLVLTDLDQDGVLDAAVVIHQTAAGASRVGVPLSGQ